MVLLVDIADTDWTLDTESFFSYIYFYLYEPFSKRRSPRSPYNNIFLAYLSLITFSSKYISSFTVTFLKFILILRGEGTIFYQPPFGKVSK